MQSYFRCLYKLLSHRLVSDALPCDLGYETHKASIHVLVFINTVTLKVPLMHSRERGPRLSPLPPYPCTCLRAVSHPLSALRASCLLVNFADRAPCVSGGGAARSVEVPPQQPGWFLPRLLPTAPL